MQIINALPASILCALPPLVLGSASPRRHKLLAQLGVEFTIAAPEAREIAIAADPVGTVHHNALAKHVVCRKAHPRAAIITADTLVWFDNRLIGKPVHLKEAATFLRAFSGRTQIIFTAVALSLPDTDPVTRVVASSATFKVLSEETISTYLAATRPLDCAGAYDIDENGDLLIASYSGSYTNIMGLPLEEVCDWLTSVVNSR